MSQEQGQQQLAGQVALVTGAGRGIGRAIAEHLAAAGAAVALLARSAEQLNETAAAVESRGGRALVLLADVTDQAAVEQAVQQAEAALGPLDLLVNNAGTSRALGPVWEVDPQLWWRDVETHVRGSFLCARAVLPGMVARRRGRIINLASNAGTYPLPYGSAYASAKAALLRFNDSLAAETREYGIAIFAMSPGTVHTAATDYLVESEEGRRWTPSFAAMPPEDWQPPELGGRLAVRLASGEADVLSGRFIHALDDLDALLRRADEVERANLYRLRVVKLEQSA